MAAVRDETPALLILQGALEHMEQTELQHWMHVATCRATATLADALQQQLDSYAGSFKPQQQAVQVSNAYRSFRTCTT